MPTPNFRFKQFEVYHDRCAMKVGMDGVTLGAWAELPALEDVSQPRILDIGTGCGLIALMLAQKYPSAQIDAIEIDPEDGAFVVEGPKIDKMLGYTNLESEKGFLFFQEFMVKNGIIEEELLLNLTMDLKLFILVIF